MKSTYTKATKSGKNHSVLAKPNIHGSKLMLLTWWDQLCVDHYELLQQRETITAALYRTQLVRLSRELKKKQLQLIRGKARQGDTSA